MRTSILSYLPEILVSDAHGFEQNVKLKRDNETSAVMPPKNGVKKCDPDFELHTMR